MPRHLPAESMQNVRILTVLFFAALLTGATSSAAQTVGATTGALSGKVTDQTGASLPDVVVVASSDAMMGTRTTTTDARGWFEVPALPPGPFTVVFSLSGFRTAIHRSVIVNLGATATVDVTLHLGGREETVLVVERSAGADRAGTWIALSLDAAQLADLPASRSMSAILAATPSVQLTRFDVGGNAAFEPGFFSAYGTTGLNRPMLEGISISGHNPLGFTLDYGSFEHVSVGLGAHAPESPWPGVQIQFITKAGGNRHRGSVYLDYENRRWQAFNIDDDQIRRGASGAAAFPPREGNRLRGYRDGNVDAGGPFRKDRLWWYASLRSQEASARQVRFPVRPQRTRVVNGGGKATAQASENSRFVVFGQATSNHQPYRLHGFLNPMASVNLSEDSTTNQTARGIVWKAEWNSLLKEKFFFEVLAGQFIAGRRERPNGVGPRFEDTNLTVLGGNRNWEESLRRDQIFASAMYVIRGRAGSHHLRLGGELQRVTSREQWHRGYLDDVLHVTQNVRPLEVYLFQTPSKSEAGLQLYALHLNESWRVTDDLTLNVGLRFDRYRAFLPAQAHPAGQAPGRSWTHQPFAAADDLIAWNVVAPRIGVSRNLTADGLTVVKGSYGRYWLPPGTDLVFNANPNSKEWWERWRWVDADADGRWDIGENVQLLDSRGGEGLESLDPRLRLTFVDEVTARVGRELRANVEIETGIVWRGLRDPFIRQDDSRPTSAFTRVVTAPDPGQDGRFGTPDDGSIVVYDLPAAASSPYYRVANVDASNDHMTWEVTAQRRFSRRWSLLAGFSHTWAQEHANGYSGQLLRANVYPLTPNDSINTGAGGRHEFRVWSARAHGSFDAAWGLRIAPFVRHQSGQPYGRTFVATNLNQGTLRVLAEPIGTRRMDPITLVDVRVEKVLQFLPDRRLSVFLDVFNVFNANPEQNVNWASDRFERPLVIVPPRIARIGVKLAW